MTGRLLVYGAGGFTGRLIVEEALARGLEPILGGRRKEALEKLSHTLLLEKRVATLEDPAAVRALLKNITVVLNAAGPFRSTARALARGCLETGAHYLDISGEHATFEELSSLDAAARTRSVLLLPGVGFDVVPSDCLAALVAARLPGATSLTLALSGLDRISRGSALTVLDKLGEPVLLRRDGRLVESSPLSLTRSFDFGEGSREATAVSWADLATAHLTTGIQNVTVYYEATAIIRFGLGLKGYAALLANNPLRGVWEALVKASIPGGPDRQERAGGHATVIAVAEDAQGRTFGARVHTPEVYSFTASTSVAIAERVLAGNYRPGFHTPGGLLGADYVLSLPGTSYAELQ